MDGGGVLRFTFLFVPEIKGGGFAARYLQVERMREWIHDIDANTQLMRRLHADPTYHTNKREGTFMPPKLKIGPHHRSLCVV
ncbi:hypothetical protein EVAR_33537_1 [Eumeta japonica]|uniref:Uncharacterized protein n=1 Tax=Eumeta variegata TaxID=151549 RepID=A0A4C1VI64_EUMVA|nr:hypothetical protein EVAR_33537_1 [Eumeta japonica]